MRSQVELSFCTQNRILKNPTLSNLDGDVQELDLRQTPPLVRRVGDQKLVQITLENHTKF